MRIFNALKDAAQVGEDVAKVALKFQDAPAQLLAAGKDAVEAVVGWDSGLAQRILDDVRQSRSVLQADAAGAASEFDSLEADILKLVNDLS